MRKLALVLATMTTLASCSKAPHSSSDLADSRPYPGAFDSASALFFAGSLPDWKEISVTRFIVGTAVFNTSKDVATDIAGFFYLAPNTTNLYLDNVFYTGVVVNWTLQDYINKVTPVIKAGNLLPMALSEDGTAYSGGYLNLVQAYYRTAVDSQNNRWFVQSRTCIAAAGCNLPDGQGNTRHFAKDELFGFTIFPLGPKPASEDPSNDLPPGSILN